MINDNQLYSLYRLSLEKPRRALAIDVIYTFNFEGEDGGRVDIIDLDNQKEYKALFMLHIDDNNRVSITIDSIVNEFKSPEGEYVTYFNRYADYFLNVVTKELELPL
ncbi:hypothetical protein [Daejeonella sp.]|uniref:hypothetical protein n=1 Tax=Daejeonella sp. TaxID=2805397 RepID=UPI00272FCDA7|nr:hypothetical protein [Daejeonella sp.]MDP2413285.1 hypothetical protein [Daejeonella sp.]